MRVLLAEDDPQLGETLEAALSLEGYAVDWLQRGDQAAHALDIEPFDAVILDIGLPGCSGLQLLQQLRTKGNALPVVLLTARDGIRDRVRGLDLGADDYLCKPFDMDELFARLRSLLRRSAGAAGPELVAGDLAMDPTSREVTWRGESLTLTSRELSVLEVLLRQRGNFVSKTRLLASVYSWDEEVGPNTVEVYISHLRKRLGSETIETLRGVGYRLRL